MDYKTKKSRGYIKPTDLDFQVEDAFGHFYLTQVENSSGNKSVEAYFSLDEGEVYKKTFYKDKKVETTKKIKNYKIIDNTIGELKNGRYKYSFMFQLEDLSKEYFIKQLDILDDSESLLRTDIQKSINLLYDVLESQRDERYKMSNMKVKRTRVQSLGENFKSDNSEVVLRDGVDGFSLIEFSKEREEKKSLDFSREEALRTFSKEDVEEVREAISFLKKNISLIMKNLGISNIFGSTDKKSIGDKSSKISYREVSFGQDLILNPKDTILEHSALGQQDMGLVSSKYRVKDAGVSNIVMSVNTEDRKPKDSSCSSGNGVIRVDDSSGNKFPTEKDTSENASILPLLDFLSEEEEVESLVRVEYLEGYKNSLKEPVWKSVEEMTEEEKGKEYLFRVVDDSGKQESTILNEYFVKRV